MYTKAVVLIAFAASAGCTRSNDGSRDAASQPLPTGIEWRLVELDGTPAGLGAGARAATLQLTADDTRATGFAGCNQFGGGYTSAVGDLRFTPLVATRMACDAGMELEQRYTAALETVRAYRLDSDTLSLLAGERVVARFVRPN